MGFIIENWKLRNKKSIVIKPSSMLDRDEDIFTDELSVIMVKLLNLYRSKIFPRVKEDIAEISSKVSASLTHEMNIGKKINVIAIPQDIVVYFDTVNEIPALRDRPVYPISLGDETTVNYGMFKKLIESTSGDRRKEAWELLNDLMGGRIGLNKFRYGKKYSALTPIVFAMAVSLSETQSPTNTLGNATGYLNLVRWVKSSMTNIMSTFVNTHLNMVQRGTIIAGVVGDDILVVSENTKKLEGLLREKIEDISVVAVITGSVLSDNTVGTIDTLIENAVRFDAIYEKRMTAVTIAKKNASDKHLKRAFENVLEERLNKSFDMIEPDEKALLRTGYKTIIDSCDDLSDITAIVEKIYGDVFYPTTGYSRFVKYITRYKDMSAGYTFDKLVSLATVEMMGDLIVENITVLDHTS